jgi:hypothetical protein
MTRGVFKGVTVSRWAGSTVMAWIALGVRRVVTPCSLAARPSVCTGPPVRVQAARLDARSIDFLGAGPTCPTCPTRIRKREEIGVTDSAELSHRGSSSPRTTDKDFASPERTGRSGWTASTTAGITRVQLRGLEVGRRSFWSDTKPVSSAS